MNIVEGLAKLLGIEVGVPFHVNEGKTIYRFDEDGAFSWKCDDGYWSRDLVLTSHFLRGILTVKWKPKRFRYLLHKLTSEKNIFDEVAPEGPNSRVRTPLPRKTAK